MQGYEGPECYQLSSGTWCLIADHYTAGTGYAPFTTTALASGSFAAAAGFNFVINPSRALSYAYADECDKRGLIIGYRPVPQHDQPITDKPPSDPPSPSPERSPA